MRMVPQSALSPAKHRPLRDRLPRDRPRCGALQSHQVGISLWKECRMGQRNEGSSTCMNTHYFITIWPAKYPITVSLCPSRHPISYYKANKGPHTWRMVRQETSLFPSIESLSLSCQLGIPASVCPLAALCTRLSFAKILR